MDRLDLMDYVTKEDLRIALEPFATRDEVRQFVQDEGERTRRHFDVVAESLRDDIKIIAEGVVELSRRVEDVRSELKADIAGLDRRLMRLEASRG